MKTTLLFLSLILIMFNACKKDENQGDSIMLRSIFSSFDTIEYFYNNAKVSKKVDNNKDGFYKSRTIDYYYHEGMIDSILYNSIYSDPLTFLYFHNADTLVRIESRGVDHTIIKFFYGNDHQVQAQSCAYLYQGSHGTWYYSDYLFTFQFSGGNIVKCIEGYRDNTSGSYVNYDTITYSYDDKHNPFSIDIDPDVFFFPFELRDFRYRNKNNIISETYSSPWASVRKIEYSYAYNSENYPETIERKTTDQFGNVAFFTERYNY